MVSPTRMVANAPDCREVLTRFAQFAGNEVLVAHNAPFDMGLLRAVKDETGQAFRNPVLDTVLLSAMVWGARRIIRWMRWRRG